MTPDFAIATYLLMALSGTVTVQDWQSTLYRLVDTQIEGSPHSGQECAVMAGMAPDPATGQYAPEPGCVDVQCLCLDPARLGPGELRLVDEAGEPVTEEDLFGE